MTSSKSVQRATPTKKDEGAALNSDMDEFNEFLARKLATIWQQEQCSQPAIPSSSAREDQPASSSSGSSG